MTERRLELVRGLGAWSSMAIVVGTMIGTGIFLKPAEMAREGHSVSIVFAAWIVGAILSLFGALSFAELGSMLPEAGGEYAYLRRGFGPVWGFLFGWMHSMVGRPASLSSIGAGLVRFLSFLIPVIATPLFTVHIAIPGAANWIAPYDFVFTCAQPLADLFADHYGGEVGIGAGNKRHDRGVCHSEPVHPKATTMLVDHRHGIGCNAHLGRATGMVAATGKTPDQHGDVIIRWRTAAREHEAFCKIGDRL